MEEAEAAQAFLNSSTNYPVLAGQQTNLYKCFLPLGWMIAGRQGAAGFLHPDGVYNDPKAGAFRAALYPRLRAHFQFQNERRLFADVDHHAAFSVNVYGSPRSSPQFAHISNLYAPATVDACLNHDGGGQVPGFKDENGNWTTAGHRERVVAIDEDPLRMFASLSDETEASAFTARLPAVHATSLLSVLSKILKHPRRLANLGADFCAPRHWDETNSQRDGTIRRETRFPTNPEDLVFSGPHFFVGNAISKTPRRRCTLSSDYDPVDLTRLPDDYLPRTNYVPAWRAGRVPLQDPTGFLGPERGASEPRLLSDYYRVANRETVAPANERTLITSLIPKQTATVHGGADDGVPTARRLRGFPRPDPCPRSSTSSSRSTGTGHMNHVNRSWLSRLPVLDDACPLSLRLALRVRALALSCLTTHYADLWQEISAADLAPLGASGGRHIDAFRPRCLDQGRPPATPRLLLRPHARLASERRPPHRLRPPPGPRRD